MQIILVDPRLKRARTLTLTRGTFALAAGGLAVGVLMAVAGLYAVTFRAGAELRVPVLHDLVEVIMRDEVERKEQFVRDNVSAMARKLGEMQAQLMRLDALGERVSKMSGIRPEEFNFKELPGRGGAEPSASRPLSLEELHNELDRISKGVGARADYMDVIQSELMAAQVRRALLPQNTPVSEGFVGSGYGMRTDPFTGQLAMHAGVDFAAPIGTPIYAAAGGVVAGAELNPVYGNLVTLDHGNDLVTRYAHASRIAVKVGDIVKKGQKIAEVGSTGRSTGPHLHFEVHVKGAPQNPSRFLAQQKAGSPFGPLAESDKLADKAAARPPVRKRSAPPAEGEAAAAAAAALPVAQPAAAAPQVDLRGLVQAATASD